MKKPASVSYLKLVAVSRNSKVEERRPPEQLTLPYLDPYTTVLIDVDRVGAQKFLSLCRGFEPKWIFDVRITPRLDLIAGTRANAFNLFEKLDVDYVDLFGELGLESYRSVNANPALWGGTLGGIVKNSRRPFGPFLILFDNKDVLEASQALLSGSVSEALGHKISLNLVA